jgi:hypothetical protein
MRITLKRGVRRLYWLLCILWAAVVLVYPYKHRGEGYSNALGACFSTDFADELYDSDGNRIVYDSTADKTFTWDTNGRYIGATNGKKTVGSTRRASDRLSDCMQRSEDTYYPKDKNVYHVFLTDEPLYEGDTKGTYWWSWLLFPLALVVPPSLIYGLLFCAFQLVRWLYRGFVPHRADTP